MIHTIICIVGASGSGKTTASMILQEQFGWKAIVSYTTRPKRKGETNGADHWFVSSDEKPMERMICAYTKFGGYEYWTTWNQFNMLFPAIYVIDEKGLIDLQSKEHGQFSIHTIKIKRDNLKNIEESRKDRDKERIDIPDERYDYIIDNNGSIEKLRTNLFLVGQCIMQKQENYGSTER